MIGALAKAAKVLDQPEFGKAAQRSGSFILDNLRSKEGKLLHRWRLGKAGLAGNAADYTFLIWGLLELYEWDFDVRWLAAAHDLTNQLINDFWDQKLGGFYLTAAQKDSFLPRIKESTDSALPSSNSLAMHNLIRLSRLTGKSKFAEKAAKISSIFSSKVKDSAPAYPQIPKRCSRCCERNIPRMQWCFSNRTMKNRHRLSSIPVSLSSWVPSITRQPPMYARISSAISPLPIQLRCWKI
jgi:uncharacterized protein YyaL (SSP411 family)